jgi:hypothetical protein
LEAGEGRLLGMMEGEVEVDVGTETRPEMVMGGEVEIWSVKGCMLDVVVLVGLQDLK